MMRHGPAKPGTGNKIITVSTNEQDKPAIKLAVDNEFTTEEGRDKIHAQVNGTSTDNQKQKENSKKKKQEKPDSEKKAPIVILWEAMQKRWYFRRNIIKQEIEYCRTNDEHRKYTSANISQITVDLKQAGHQFPGGDIEHLLNSDFVQDYNPVKQWITSLPTWDGKEDYIEHLASFVKAEHQKAFNKHFKMTLVRMLACSLGRCFNKQCFTLVGKQNDGKSTFLRFLCPPELSDYITENIDPRDKDGIAALCQNFMINLDELAMLGISTINNIKALFSLDKVKYRPPYAKKPETLPRIANFVGSTNSESFLTDETGSVRWLCFKIKKIDFQYYTQCDIRKVYSQAYALLNEGFDYNLSQKDVEENHRRNQAFEHTTSEYELILKHVTPAKKDKEKFKMASDIRKHLDLVAPTIREKSDIGIGKALKKAGFEKKPLKKAGQVIYGYYVELT
ncbi:VapE family protein [Cytophagaceae bacterium YF14B1]|uniref:VapE family protein n=1 Tax=Xanthocytophaga flava TaxID=3048013 RepID=A0AAE3QM52_9BACT|nr:VapE domain-containing protein [Xanthocytophaga flavus]MDJ1481882.1 VapE family protein [Xanthocytophaga flavus]